MKMYKCKSIMNLSRGAIFDMIQYLSVKIWKERQKPMKMTLTPPGSKWEIRWDSYIHYLSLKLNFVRVDKEFCSSEIPTKQSSPCNKILKHEMIEQSSQSK